MDIGSGHGGAASSLSNFTAHRFFIDGICCESMEGWLQSLKFKSPDMQEHVCSLIGKAAKFKGKSKKWWKTQTLWWRGKEIDRHSEEYQKLLDRAYDAISINIGFRNALLSTRDATLTHSMGNRDDSHTILTEREFVSRLTKVRTRLQNEERNN
jgi:hypothetical protein